MDVRAVSLKCGVKSVKPCAGLYTATVASAVGRTLMINLLAPELFF